MYFLIISCCKWFNWWLSRCKIFAS